MEAETTRQQIADALRDGEASPTALAAAFQVSADEAVTHVRHLARSLDATDEELLVAPPSCRDCGFADFDYLANRPSRCPECRSENVAEPVFTVE